MRLRLSAIAIAFSILIAACGGGSGGSKSSPTTGPSATSSTAELAIIPPTSTTGPFSGSTGSTVLTSPSSRAGLRITPASGAAGTAFAFAVAGFKPGEVLHFAITSPAGKTTVGPAHTVTPAGAVSASYSTTSTSATGKYSVKATGDRGNSATGGFEVTASRSSTTVRPANTTLHTTTTRH